MLPVVPILMVNPGLSAYVSPGLISSSGIFPVLNILELIMLILPRPPITSLFAKKCSVGFMAGDTYYSGICSNSSIFRQ